ncbi:MAG: thioesterase family protein [Caulobacteraceae bacterium]|nr:thioesterase family protein [Caulobacteraceae bacterium]
MKPEISRLARAQFPHFTDVQTRNQDVDHLRHINNVSIAAYYDEGRASFTRAIFERAGDIPGLRLVTAQANISYLAEVFHPGMARIGCGVLRIGGSSYEIGQALFQNGRCAGVCTAVFVNAPQGGAAPLPHILVDVLQGFVLADAPVG